MTVLAAIDIGPVTDIIGIPLAAVVVGLLVLIDLVGLEADDVTGDGDGGATRTLPIPGFLANRRTLIISAVVASFALLAVFAARVIWIAA